MSVLPNGGGSGSMSAVVLLKCDYVCIKSSSPPFLLMVVLCCLCVCVVVMKLGVCGGGWGVKL